MPVKGSARSPDDKQIAQALVEDELGRAAAVRACQHHC